MSCKIIGSSAGSYEFKSHSGTAPDNQQCTIGSGAKGIRHVVRIEPLVQKYKTIRVKGRIDADPNTARAEFHGPKATPNGMEWQDEKPVSTVEVVFDSEEIRNIRTGSENIKTIVEEQSRWNTSLYYQIDQNDLTITVTLS
jgi:hypothetical protein